MTKYTATIKGTMNKNQLGDILFKGKYREKREEDRVYGLIVSNLMKKIEAEYRDEDDKYLVRLINGLTISFTKEQFEGIYDLTEVEETEK